MALAQTEPLDPLPADLPASITLFPASYAQVEGFRRLFEPPTTKTFSLDLVPRLIELKALYLERRQESSVLTSPLSDSSPAQSQWGRYFDILATSSQFDGKLVGESELAYSALGISPTPEQRLATATPIF